MGFDNVITVPTTLPLLDDSIDIACCAPLSASPLSEQAAPTLARAFAALGDPVRLRLISLLMTDGGGEICACDLVEPVGKSQPTVSHHLKVLRDAGLVTATRRGKNIWYAAAPDQITALRAVLAPGPPR
jgi:ArsR family transcriptional regulator, arsenate/arsenite/antimonite-responsive transcriptional repressor